MGAGGVHESSLRKAQAHHILGFLSSELSGTERRGRLPERRDGGLGCPEVSRLGLSPLPPIAKSQLPPPCPPYPPSPFLPPYAFRAAKAIFQRNLMFPFLLQTVLGFATAPHGDLAPHLSASRVWPRLTGPISSSTITVYESFSALRKVNSLFPSHGSHPTSPHVAGETRGAPQPDPLPTLTTAASQGKVRWGG